MLTLSIDTTGDFGSVALLDGMSTVEEVLLHEPRGFSHILFAEIDAVLKRNSVKLVEIMLYASASGPGSFTGVRVGLSAVKGFAEVQQRPVIAVSNLVALATFGSQPRRAVIIDARRGEVYAAVYDERGNAVIPEQVISFSKFLDQLPDERLEWICNDFSAFSWAPREDPVLVTAPKALAAAIGRVALDRLAKGGEAAFPPEAIDANYVRRSDAELFWKEV